MLGVMRMLLRALSVSRLPMWVSRLEREHDLADRVRFRTCKPMIALLCALRFKFDTLSVCALLRRS
jgi:hypothetical protein